MMESVYLVFAYALIVICISVLFTFLRGRVDVKGEIMVTLAKGDWWMIREIIEDIDCRYKMAGRRSPGLARLTVQSRLTELVNEKRVDKQYGVKKDGVTPVLYRQKPGHPERSARRGFQLLWSPEATLSRPTKTALRRLSVLYLFYMSKMK